MQDEQLKDGGRVAQAPAPAQYQYQQGQPGWQQDPYEEEIDLFELWELIWGGRVKIAVITFAVTLLAIIYAFIQTPIFRSEALVSLVGDEGDNRMGALASQYGGLAAMAGIELPGGGDSQKDVVLATLKSRRFLGDFIREENLSPMLFEDSWDAEEKRWLVAEDERPSELQAIKALDGLISVEESKGAGKGMGSGLLTVAVEWKDPEVAAVLANTLVRRLNATMKDQQIQKSEKSIDYLERQLMRTNNAENRKVLYGIIESNVKSLMLAEISDEVSLKVIDPAVAPEERSKPQRMKIALIGMLLGLFLGVAGVLVPHGLQQAMERRKGA